MATKSFLKSIYIKDKRSAKAFVQALENAEHKGKKKVNIDVSVNNISDTESIKRMFGAK